MFNPYRLSQHTRIDTAKRISIVDIKRAFLKEMTEKYGKGLKRKISINTDKTAEKIKKIINEEFSDFRSLNMPQHDYSMQVDFVKSNLGKGYLFYFICAGCGRRTLHLYQPSEYTDMLRCRICHQLGYKKKPSKATRIRRLLRHPDTLVNYLSSTPQHYAIAEKALQAIIDLRNQLKKE